MVSPLLRGLGGERGVASAVPKWEVPQPRVPFSLPPRIPMVEPFGLPTACRQFYDTGSCPRWDAGACRGASPARAHPDAPVPAGTCELAHIRAPRLFGLGHPFALYVRTRVSQAQGVAAAQPFVAGEPPKETRRVDAPNGDRITVVLIVAAFDWCFFFANKKCTFGDRVSAGAGSGAGPDALTPVLLARSASGCTRRRSTLRGGWRAARSTCG